MQAEATLENRLGTALAKNPYLARRNVRIEAQQGRVTLKGVVTTYFQKQMAQEALRNIDGVAEIENQLQVDWVS